MRQLATIRRIDKIEPIPEADRIEVCTVGGWKVVSQKGIYQEGDLAVYLEVDSWVPEKIAPWMVKEKKAKEYNGVPGERLRTIRLRGQVSQGLLLPMSEFHFPRAMISIDNDGNAQGLYLTGDKEGDDVTTLLGIQLYEKPIPTQLAGVIKRNWPSTIRKTDQERVQNLTKYLEGWIMEGGLWEVTEKLDGSSMTAYIEDGEFGVCSRNLDLKESDDNAFWRVAREIDLEGKMRSLGRNLAFQGELVGSGIQKNHYRLNGLRFFLFDVWDIENQVYFSPTERSKLAEELDLVTVPVHSIMPITKDIDWFLEYATGVSHINPIQSREGLVFRWLIEPYTSFKVISNEYLLNNDE